MAEKVLVKGNEAVGWGAVNAGVDAFFGYPITPQNEVIEWMARELPKRGKTFVQIQSENGAIMTVYGGAAAGFRVMTSTAGPGWSLMQEGMSHLAAADLPCVVVLTQRGGPGQGSIRHAQMDYAPVTRGGGAGGYKQIVLAPNSVQEIHDFVQLAFHLADKYCNPVIVLSDGILGLILEAIEIKATDFEPVPEKDWAVKGRDRHPETMMRRFVHSSTASGKFREGFFHYGAWLEHFHQKHLQMAENEVRHETSQVEDADLVIIAFGYVSRVCTEAINRARSEGLRVGMLRPITLWPLPSAAIREQADRGRKILVVEDNLGQLVDDVQCAVQGKTEVHFLGMLSRHLPNDGGMIMPGTVLNEIRRII
ncbi:MAG: 3-methyl-2-oxobutanoate dehydrogenase subunit VorB [Dehalococcoidia bacterium]